MSWDQIEGRWKEPQARFGEKWGNLAADDRAAVAGRRDTLGVCAVRGAGRGGFDSISLAQPKRRVT